MTRPILAPSATPDTVGRDTTGTVCKRGCCWTPYGHSNARDGYLPSHQLACHCHHTTEDPPVGRQFDSERVSEPEHPNVPTMFLEPQKGAQR